MERKQEGSLGVPQGGLGGPGQAERRSIRRVAVRLMPATTAAAGRERLLGRRELGQTVDLRRHQLQARVRQVRHPPAVARVPTLADLEAGAMV